MLHFESGEISIVFRFNFPANPERALERRRERERERDRGGGREREIEREF